MTSHHSSPVTDWLRSLAAVVHERCGGPGVGAVGMCFTGNFALSLMLEPALIKPILSQPSLPLANASGLHIEPSELERIRARLVDEDLTVSAYRFEGDRLCTSARFEAYQEALGSALEPGEPMFEALQDMIEFLRLRLA